MIGLHRKTSPFGRYMPDAVLQELAQIPLDDGPSGDHFDGFADDELLLAGQFRASVDDMAWLRETVVRCAGHGADASDADASSVAERFAACLLALDLAPNGADELFLYSGAQADAQRAISQILIRNPVLMHPRIRIRVRRGSEVGYVTVAHAIASSACGGRLPMARDGFEQERLAAFSIDSRVHIGLSSRQVSQRQSVGALRGLTPMGVALREPGNPAFLASLLDLGAYFDLSRSQSWASNCFHDRLLQKDEPRARLLDEWLKGIISSDLDPYPETSSGLKESCSVPRSALADSIAGAVRRLLHLEFPKTREGASKATNRLVRGLHAAGCAPTTETTAHWLASVIKSSDTLPSVFEAAVGVALQLEQQGVTMRAEQLSTDAPFAWTQALNAVRHQRELLQALNTTGADQAEALTVPSSRSRRQNL